MCGRDYYTYSIEERELRYAWQKESPWEVEPSQAPMTSNYNQCPTHKTQVLRVLDRKIGFHEMRWGLVPAWANSVEDADKYSMINAKAEEITEKRSFKSAFQKRRCIVPVSGFFEWHRVDKVKTPYLIRHPDKSIMSLAGIWEHWVSKETGEIVDSYSLITTAANTLMSKIHTRMPIILEKESEQSWLDPENSDPKNLMPFLKPCLDENLEMFQISTLVNSPKNNNESIIAPLTP